MSADINYVNHAILEPSVVESVKRCTKMSITSKTIRLVSNNTHTHTHTYISLHNHLICFKLFAFKNTTGKNSYNHPVKLLMLQPFAIFCVACCNSFSSAMLESVYLIFYNIRKMLDKITEFSIFAHVAKAVAHQCCCQCVVLFLLYSRTKFTLFRLGEVVRFSATSHPCCCW
jgi:hypothetical protein